MAYERHDVFNIGPTGTPQADPRFAEQMALAQFQASQDNAERMIQEQAKSREAEAIQAQIARAQEISDRDWHHQNVTMPGQQMAMMKAITGLQGEEADRQMAQAKFGADIEDREYTRSFKEREAKRKSRDKELARDHEGRQWEKEKQWDLDQFKREKDHELKKHSITEFYKDQKNRRSDAEKRDKERRAQEENLRKETEAKDKEAIKTIQSSAVVYDTSLKMHRGQDITEDDLAQLVNEISLYTPLQKSKVKNYLHGSFERWVASKEQQLKAEEEQHRGASTGLSTSFWNAIGQGEIGEAYVQEKMAPARQQFERIRNHLAALLNSLD